jgi:hypothetical protein
MPTLILSYRCFTKNNRVVTLSPYRRGEVRFSSCASPLQGPREESEAAAEFANSVPCPRAFVLDVGVIKGRGWAVVEPNERWGAGLYGCLPAGVLEVLLAATLPRRMATEDDVKWDYDSNQGL